MRLAPANDAQAFFGTSRTSVTIGKVGLDWSVGLEQGFNVQGH